MILRNIEQVNLIQKKYSKIEIKKNELNNQKKDNNKDELKNNNIQISFKCFYDIKDYNYARAVDMAGNISDVVKLTK